MTLGHPSRFIGVAVALAVGLALAGCTAGAAPRAAATKSGSSAQAHTDDKYGSLPSFLPKDSTKPDSTLIGSAGNPAITSQGDSVKVKFGSGSVLMSVAGPVVPGEGLPYQASATTCTWTVTITATGAAIPIATKDFTSIDHLGAIYRPTFVAGQKTPPAILAPGQTTTFELRSVMEVGEGLMRWAPDGKHIVASWDFEVEND
jgi:outer membrane lipoprotein SlyB